MVEADARELAEGNRQDGEIDAGDPESERQEADDGAGRGGGDHRRPQPDPGTDAEVHV